MIRDCSEGSHIAFGKGFCFLVVSPCLLIPCEGRGLEQPEQVMLGHVVQCLAVHPRLCTDTLGCCSDCKSLLGRLV